MAVEMWQSTGLSGLGLGELVMLAIGVLLCYLAIFKKFEPLLLLPIGFGAILANLPFAPIMSRPEGAMPGGLFYYLYSGVEKEIFPPLIFMVVGRHDRLRAHAGESVNASSRGSGSGWGVCRASPGQVLGFHA